jgi:hypothetical protein
VIAVAAIAALAPPAAGAADARTSAPRDPAFQRAFGVRAKRAFDVGLRAYVYGLPLLNQQRVISIFPANLLINVTRLSNPAQRLVVLPNVDTLYTVARLRLQDGPLVLHVPDLGGRYYTMQFLDAYTNSFAYVGRRATGTRPGNYAIAPPGWRGRVPSGVRLIRSPTPVVWLLGRTLVDGEPDLPAVNAIQRQYTLTPLARFGGAPNSAIFLPSSNLRPGPLPEGLAFFDRMGELMKENPPPRRDRALIRSFRRLGIGAGLKTSTRKLSTATRSGLAAAVEAGPGLVAAYGRRQQRISARRNNGWRLAAKGIGNFGRNFLLRADISETALGANVREEAIYPVTEVDSRGRPLTGAHSYRLRFKRGQLPPVNAFWSLTMYGPDRFLVENPIARYAVGNRTPGLKRNADGSLDVWLQHDAPAGRESNWLPAPAGRFSLALRLYEPKRLVLRERWPLPTVSRLR